VKQAPVLTMSGARIMSDKVSIGGWLDNRYEIFDIRKGGMGVVYIVYDHEGEFGPRVLALKTVRDEFLLDTKQVTRFITEIKTWIKLDRHPNIVRAYSVQVIAGTPYVVLELVTGGDLRRWLGTSRLNLPQTLRFGIQFCMGMEHALRKGLYCHRDIKPENLLITIGGTLKITDFGLAKVRDDKIHGRGHHDPIPVVGEEIPLPSGSWSDHMNPPPSVEALDLDDSSEVDDPPPPDDPLLDPWALAQEEMGITTTTDWTPRPSLQGRDPGRDPVPKPPTEPINETVDMAPSSETVDMASGSETVDMAPDAIHLNSSVSGDSEREVTQAGAVLGTAIYMAPEQFRDAKNVTSLADLYSFGVVLFEMIATKPPFQGKTFAKLKRQHTHGIPPSLVSYIPRKYARYAKHIDKIVRRCLEKDSAQRFASFAELRLALSKALWWVAREKVELPTEMEYDAWELTSRGVALGTFGRLDEERECYDEAIKTKPDYVPAWFNTAAVLGSLGKFNEAVEHANFALHFNPGSVPALINKGLALYAMKRPEEALACFDHAGHLQPRDPAIWYGRALVLLWQGNAEGARAAVNQLQRLQPEGSTELPPILGPNLGISPSPGLPGVGPSPGARAPTDDRAAIEARRLQSIPWLRRTEDTLSESKRSG